MKSKYCPLWKKTKRVYLKEEIEVSMKSSVDGDGHVICKTESVGGCCCIDRLISVCN